MERYKSKKINEVINKYGRSLNLHEIKVRTGAGNGHKYSYISADSTVTNTTNNNNLHKIEKIYTLLANIKGNVNLHKIKAQTGVGNGYRY